MVDVLMAVNLPQTILTQTNMKLLLDLDPIVYRLGFASETKNEDGVVVPDPIGFCLHSVKVYLKGVYKDTKATSVRGFLSSSDNFRDKVVPDYKGNRSGFTKPIHYQAIRDYMVNVFNAEIQYGIEADDRLCLEQTDDTMIASIDKDLMICAGKHYNYVTGEFTDVTPEQGIKNFYGQMLSGDGVDYIAGIKGIGKTKAHKLLEGTPIADWDDLVMTMYEDFHVKALEKMKGFTEEEKLLTKNHDFLAFVRDGAFGTLVNNSMLLWMLQSNVKMPIDVGRLVGYEV